MTDIVDSTPIKPLYIFRCAGIKIRSKNGRRMKMYFRMLKNDLKHKKTLNIILLIFMVLAANFIASGISTILTVTAALDNYIDRSELAPYMVFANENQSEALNKFLSESDKVKSYKSDDHLIVTSDNFTAGDKIIEGNGILGTINIKSQKFFDEHDNVLETVNDGEIYMPNKSFDTAGFKFGDKVTIKSGSTEMTFTVKGKIKDAFLGSPFMGITRFIISDKDYKRLKNSGDFAGMYLYAVDTDDTAGVNSDLISEGIGVTQTVTKEAVMTTYTMDIVTAVIFLVVSVCLIIISLIIMRFTILFTLQEEYREIGIMKAIGITERRIRGLYIVKYLALAVAGSAIGFVMSIPLQNIFIAQSSPNIVMSGVTSLWNNVLSCIFLVAIVVLFCYLFTRRVIKFSPVDAVRSGSTGERFKRKGVLRLSKSHIRPAMFLAINDIISGIKTFAALILIFTVGVLLIIIPANTISTLKSDHILRLFSISESDLYLLNDSECIKLHRMGTEYIENYLENIETKLRENGIESKGVFEQVSSVYISYKDKNACSLSFKGIGTTSDQYDYLEGTPPVEENELSLTYITADAVGAKIGDTVKIKYNGVEKDFIVTAMYQSMNNMGEGIRFSEKANIIDSNDGMIDVPVQIKYTDSPSESEKQSRRELIEKLYPDFTVYSGGEYASFMMGNITDSLDSSKALIVTLVVIINMLVSVLMVKTFLIKERAETAMLKSLGFKSSDVIKRQVLRIGIVLLVSILLALLVSEPISQFTSGKVFEFMGASRIEFEMNTFEIFILYPVILFTSAMLSSIITALGARKITSSEINNVD